MSLTFFPRRRILAEALAAAAVLILASLGGGARPVLALTNCSVGDLTFDAEEQEFLRLINEYRAQNGMSALTASANLNRSASWMARDLAVNRYFSHTDSAGRAPAGRVANCEGSPYVGENLAAGTIKDTAAEAFEMWRASSGHNANMLNSSYRQIGIARYYDAGAPYRWYWVTDFSTSNDGTDLGGSGEAATATPPPPQAPAEDVSPIGAMISPATGATLGTSTTFTWSRGSESSAYFFYMGTWPGSNNMLGVDMGAANSLTVHGLPRTGGTVYVRLWSLTAAGWQFKDYTYALPQ